MSASPVEHPFEADRLNEAGEFNPGWDVPSIGREASDALTAAVDSVRKSPAPNGTRKIHVLLGPAGHGKTHLFGRVLHAQAGRVQFAYVPMTGDPARVRPAEHIRYEVIEGLFCSTGEEFPPLRRHLARLIAPSFAAYLDQLSDALRDKVAPIRRRLDTDPTVVFELLGPVDTLSPYSHLADSVRRRFPDVSAAGIRAAVLSLSPAGDDARTWLRGEAESLSDERLRELLLTEAPPDPTAVLKVIAVILQELGTPLLLCLDQLEILLQKDPASFGDLTATLMAWLQEVPNFVLALGCPSDLWKQCRAGPGFASFFDRTREWTLDELSADQASELVVRRIRSWPAVPSGKPDGWPFDLPNLRQTVTKTSASPRALLQECRNRFDEWAATGRNGEIKLSVGEVTLDPDAEFMKEWTATLEKVSREIKAATHYSLDQLLAGIEEAVLVAQLGGYLPTGVELEKHTVFNLKKVGALTYPAIQIDLLAGPTRFPVVVALGKPIENGTSFNSWFDALDTATKPPVVGAVAVWSIAKPFSGGKSKGWDKYRERVTGGAVRTFALDENVDTFRQLEALREFVILAKGQNLKIGGQVIQPEECRKRLARTKALANLKLFEMLFHNWPELAPSVGRSAPIVKTSPAPAPAPPVASHSRAATATATKVAPVPAATATVVLPLPPPLLPPVPVSSGGEAWAQGMLDTVVQKLRARGQPVRPAGFELGPTFARLKVEPKDDTDFAKVKKQADNLKLHMALDQRPLIANQAGFISIDIQRSNRQVVPLDPILNTRLVDLVGRPAFVAGVDVAGKTHWLNLADHDTCHLLIAGTTGSGKSEFLKSMIAGLANHLLPSALQFFLVDPKQVTFGLSGPSPYLAAPVVYDANEAIPVLDRCCEEMERRYTLLRKLGKENIDGLAAADAVPRWVVVFDEFADLMADKRAKSELESSLKRLGAKARAAGIHLVLGTQRPEASVVTPLLRSNLPGRISLRVISEKDSKLILPDQPDAAYLLGKGDLFWWFRGGLIRLQSPFVSRTSLEQLLRIG